MGLKKEYLGISVPVFMDFLERRWWLWGFSLFFLYTYSFAFEDIPYEIGPLLTFIFILSSLSGGEVRLFNPMISLPVSRKILIRTWHFEIIVFPFVLMMIGIFSGYIFFPISGLIPLILDMKLWILVILSLTISITVYSINASQGYYSSFSSNRVRGTIDKKQSSIKMCTFDKSMRKRDIIFSNPIVHISIILFAFFFLILFLSAVSRNRTIFSHPIGGMNFWIAISFFIFFVILNHFSWRLLLSIRMLVMLPIAKSKIVSYIILISLFTALLFLIVLFFVFGVQPDFRQIPYGFILACVLCLLSLSMLGYCLKLHCNPQDAYAITLVLLIILFNILMNHNIRESYSFYLPFIIILLSLFSISLAWLFRLLYSSSASFRKKRGE